MTVPELYCFLQHPNTLYSQLPMYEFRQKHLLELLDGYESSKMPIDYYVSHYFRACKALGSKDRAYLAEQVYRLIRWKGLIDFFLDKAANKSVSTSETETTSFSWMQRIQWIQENEPKAFLRNDQIPEYTRVSFPEELYELFKESLGTRAFSIALACNEQAPTCIRVNTLKTTTDALLQRLQQQSILASKAHESSTAIYIHQKCNFFVLPEFKEGLFEVQDEASQLVAQKIAVLPGQNVLDFCAGSGGKALAFAPFMQQKGQIYLHDVRAHVLLEAKKRLKRAGVQNAQTIASTDQARLKKLKKKMDWVLVDAPCSGTGTLRRNPDMKWKLTPEMLKRFVADQRVIFEQALSFVKPNGYIVYATCSMLRDENRQQVEHFLKTYPLELVGECFESYPEQGKMDGFFAASFRKTN